MPVLPIKPRCIRREEKKNAVKTSVDVLFWYLLLRVKITLVSSMDLFEINPD